MDGERSYVVRAHNRAYLRICPLKIDSILHLRRTPRMAMK